MHAAVLALCVIIALIGSVHGAGRAFPIDSENYVTEQFKNVNQRLEWDHTNFLVDFAGHYANCGQLRNTGQISIDRRTPEGDTISGFVDTIDGTGTDINAVNGYIRSLVDRWSYSRTYNHMIRNARRFGCSVRPGCSSQVVVSCLFSPGGRPGDIQYDQPDEQTEQLALAFTPQQYVVAERRTGNKWDRSHLLENLSGYETSCSMIGSDDWPFSKARPMAVEHGMQVTGVYGSVINEGSTDLAIERILENFKQIQYAVALGCSIIPDCDVGPHMYVVVSCLYQE